MEKCDFVGCGQHYGKNLTREFQIKSMDFSPAHSGYNVAKQDEIIQETKSDPMDNDPDHLDPLFIYLISFTVVVVVLVVGFVLFCKFAAHKIPYLNRPVDNTNNSDMRHERLNNHRPNRNNRHHQRISWITPTGNPSSAVHGSHAPSGSVHSANSIIMMMDCSPSGNSFYLHSLSSGSSLSSTSSLSSYSGSADTTVHSNNC